MSVSPVVDWAPPPHLDTRSADERHSHSELRRRAGIKVVVHIATSMAGAPRLFVDLVVHGDTIARGSIREADSPPS